MRTRIALAAIVPVAISTVTIVSQAATEQTAHAVTVSPATTSVAVNHLTTVPPATSSYLGLNPGQSFNGWSAQMINLNGDLVAGTYAVPIADSSPTPPPPPPPPPPAPPVVRRTVVRAVPAAAPPATVAIPYTAPVATPAPAPTSSSGIVDTVTPAQRAAWERVAMCEEGGNWYVNGSRFSGGLGISRANWVAYGGLEFAPYGAAATPDEQIMVAERIQANPPDQHGCAAW